MERIGSKLWEKNRENVFLKPLGLYQLTEKFGINWERRKQEYDDYVNNTIAASDEWWEK